MHLCEFRLFGICICGASIRPSVRWFATRHGTGSLGHRGNGSFGSSFTSGSPGNRVIILTRCETVVFPVFEKMAKMQNLHLKCWNDKSHCQVSVVGLKSLVSPCNELLLLPMIIKNSLAWEYFFTHKSTFGVHYRTGSPSQLGLRVAGFPVTGSLGHKMWPSSISVCYCSPAGRRYRSARRAAGECGQCHVVSVHNSCTHRLVNSVFFWLITYDMVWNWPAAYWTIASAVDLLHSVEGWTDWLWHQNPSLWQMTRSKTPRRVFIKHSISRQF